MLNIIQDNVFRTLGTSANAKVKERLANISKIKAYTRVNKELSFPYDMSDVLGKPLRTQEIIDNAISKLNFPTELLKYALFWIYTITPEQQEAASYIAKNDLKKAKSLYNKSDDFGSLISVSTISFITKSDNVGVKSLNKILQSPEIRNEFISFICEINGHTLEFSEDDLMHTVIDILLESITTKDLLKIYVNLNKQEESSFNLKAIDYIKHRDSNVIISQLNSIIEKFTSENHHPEDAFDACPEFIKTYKSQLRVLDKHVGKNSSEYQDACDKVVKEILCVVSDYLKEVHIIPQDSYKRAIDLCKKASDLACANSIKFDCVKVMNMVKESKNLHKFFKMGFFD